MVKYKICKKEIIEDLIVDSKEDNATANKLKDDIKQNYRKKVTNNASPSTIGASSITPGVQGSSKVFMIGRDRLKPYQRLDKKYNLIIDKMVEQFLT